MAASLHIVEEGEGTKKKVKLNFSCFRQVKYLSQFLVHEYRDSVKVASGALLAVSSVLNISQ